MSDDEVFVLVISTAAAIVLWGRWLYHTVAASGFGRSRPLGAMVGSPLAGAAIIMATLLTLAADDVRHDAGYIVLYMAFGAAWVRLWLLLLPLMGVSPRADVLERRNRAAGVAVAGAIIGLSLCYAGSNIGNGPGWWVVLFTALLATASLFALWGLLQALTGVSDLVTIERDVSAAVRLAGVLIAAGLVMGRGAAGDWHGYDRAASDFVSVSWPVIALLLVESGVSAMLKPRPDNPRPGVADSGLAPAIVYVACAMGYTLMLGWPA